MTNIDEEYRKELRLRVEQKPTVNIKDIGKSRTEKLNAKNNSKYKAEDLIGTSITKDGEDYGKIIKIVSITKGSSNYSVAVTDKDIKLKVDGIFRLLERRNASDKNYPQGSEFSHRVLNAPRSRGKGGHALKGKHEIDDKAISYYRKHYHNKGGFYSE